MKQFERCKISQSMLLAWTLGLGVAAGATADDRLDAPPPQNNPSIAALLVQSAGVLYGGWIIDAESRYAGAETWLLHDDSWQRARTANSPGPRAFHCASACQQGEGVLIFGGSCDGVRLNDTWRFDGRDWIQVARSGGEPPPRSSACMAYDAGRDRVVLFGGRGEDGLLGDTWEWDGSDWIAGPNLGPSPRRHHTMAFDPVGGGILLYGGATDEGPSGETWRWDGAEWIRLELDATPGARDHHGMTTDPAHWRIVVFGGWDGETELGDTWQWDGEAWSELEVLGATPAARGGRPALYFDRRSASVILYAGGFTDQGPRTDAWRLENDRWMRIGKPDSVESGE